MGLLWENLSNQLDRVRSTTVVTSAAGAAADSASVDDPSDRRRRLQKALEAIRNSGNAMMIESLTAAIEGREANLNLPELPDGIAKF
ncbi:MAG: hypothetical protein O2972_02965 [Cyanobacteria bacterium]|jgi:hypothetical protein|nr:hypothetical protein [Cyanobacteriota bacterium]